MSDPGAPVRVFVADDHPLWREALARDLAEGGFLVVGTAADGPSTVSRCRATVPDVLVLDLNMPGRSGHLVCQDLAPLPIAILVLSASGEQRDVLEAVKAGAAGYLVKSASAEEIREAVAATARGEAVFTPGLAGLVLGEFRAMAGQASGTPGGRRVPELTARETEILRLVATGATSREIAAELVLSHRTVQNHVQNILGKLHLHNRVELTRFAYERGLEDDGDGR